MNKHTRFVVSLLFVMMMILAAAITRSYFNAPEITGDKNSPSEIVRKLESDGSGNRIFADSSGMYGVVDKSDRIIVAPEWLELRFTDNNSCIAAKDIGGKKLFGCVNYEGNIIVPLIYSSIKKMSESDTSFYSAVSAIDSSVVIYDSKFCPCFKQSWKSCVSKKDEFTLADEKGVYVYSTDSSDPVFKSASVSGSILDNSYELDITSRILLSKLSVPIIESISSITEKYIEYAFTGENGLLSEINSGGKYVFQQLFPDEHTILTKKLVGISDMYLYSMKSEDGSLGYELRLTADTIVTYNDETGKNRSLRGAYQASVVFALNSRSDDVIAVSGSFSKTKPDYPQVSEEPSQPTTTAAETKNPNN